MLSVSSRMSTNTGTAPRRTKAVAVDENVNDGMITSSPSPISASSAASSRAAVHDGVSSTRSAPVLSSSHSSQRRPNGPLPDSCSPSIAWAMYSNSRPAAYGRLNGMSTWKRSMSLARTER